MDVLRTCYRTQMRFTAGSAIKTPVVWYWAPPNAKVFGRHSFGSSSWIPKTRTNNGVGEAKRISNRAYSKGALPGRYTGTGGFCGQREWYRTGAPPGAPLPQRDLEGVPSCCGRLFGGLFLGGHGQLVILGPGRVVIGAGGGSAGGSAAVQIRQGYVGAGGGSAGGTAAVQVRQGYVGAGGGSAGGTAAVTFVPAIAGSGGGAGGGSATVALIWPITGSGGGSGDGGQEE